MSFFDILKHAHSGIRYLLLVLLVAFVVTSLWGWLGRRKFGKGDNQLGLALFITTHLQLTLGLVLYSLWVMQANVFADMKNTMGTPILRYYTVEHLTGMLIAIVLITFGRIRAKKGKTDGDKFRLSFLFNFVALAIVAVMLLTMPK